jgi:kynurenine formamidase
MHVEFNIAGVNYSASLEKGVSLALGFGPNAENPNAFYIPKALFEPIKVGDFVGAVKEGGSANCEMVTYCAHGNGTHTECVGHLSKERINVIEMLLETNLSAQLITVPLKKDGIYTFIDKDCLKTINWEPTSAIIIRSTPNEIAKKSNIWSGTNPPYFTPEAIEFIKSKGYHHILTDFPSIDPEEDGGELLSHRVWWNYPSEPRYNATITELIYVPNSLQDGIYFMQLGLPRIFSDAVPSNPILYPLIKKD